eukprot:m.185654 g.185654  ORF g.185654 m.185654 type:complete len:697 (-) comp16519_c0_seq1:116-2206(-)
MARGDKRRRKDDSTKSRRSEPSDVKANSPAKRLKGDSNGSVGVAKSGPSASAVINEKPKRTAPVQDEPQLSPEELRSAGLADCTALRNVVDRLCSTSGDPTSAEVRDLLTASLLLTTDVKRVVRTAYRNWRDAADQTTAMRDLVDERYLQLQNVMFEKMHVNNEIRRCQRFRSRHHDLDLLPAKEALGDDTPPEVFADAHQLMLARLENELAVRRRLRSERARLAEAKTEAERTLERKREQLQKLPKLLQKVLNAAKPVVAYFESTEAEPGAAAAGDRAAFLPTPLYVLHACLADYRALSPTEYTVEVVGNLKAARDPAVLKLWEGTANTQQSRSEDADADADADAMAVDGKPQRRLGEAEGKSAAELAAAAERRLLHKHPLTVLLKLGCGLSLEFAYLLELRTVTVITAGDDGSAALRYMYPNDTGLTLPSEAAELKMEHLGLKPYAEYTAELGCAFKWAQHICGCQVDGAAAAETVEARQRRRDMTRVVRDIEAHVVATASLKTQLHHLSKGNLTIELPAQVEKTLFPLETNVKLKSWTSVPGEPSDIVLRYETTLTRGAASLKAAVEVNKVYPTVPPTISIVAISTGTAASPSSSATDDDGSVLVDPNFQAMEREVNVHFDELTAGADASLLLSLQVRRLVMCFDVYCECVAIEGGAAPAAGKLFERATRGKDRIYPYLFDHKLGVFVHREAL